LPLKERFTKPFNTFIVTRQILLIHLDFVPFGQLNRDPRTFVHKSGPGTVKTNYRDP
jgi:hypothetical protein